MVTVFSYYVYWYSSMPRNWLHVGGTQHIVVESINKRLLMFLFLIKEEKHYNTQFSVVHGSIAICSLLRNSSLYYFEPSLPFTLTMAKYRFLSFSKVSKHIKSHFISKSETILLWENWKMFQTSSVWRNWRTSFHLQLPQWTINSTSFSVKIIFYSTK